MNFPRFMLGRAAQRIVRFHTNPTVEVQTVGAHSFGVCLILLELTDGKASAELLKAGLYHDVPEAITGDIPSPAFRRFNDLRLGSKIAEAKVKDEHKLEATITQEEHQLLVLADRLECAFFCLEEWERGNRNAKVIVQRIVEWIHETDLLGPGPADGESRMRALVKERFNMLNSK